MADHLQPGETSEGQAELLSLQRQAEEYLNGWKRALADYENLKKSQVKHQEELRRYLVSEIFLSVLPLMEHYEQALAHIPAQQQETAWYEGLLHLRSQWKALLQRYDITAVRPEGEMFNPDVHEAIETKTVPERADNEIVGVASEGYLLGDSLLRPAKVIVNKVPLSAQTNP